MKRKLFLVIACNENIAANKATKSGSKGTVMELQLCNIGILLCGFVKAKLNIVS